MARKLKDKNAPKRPLSGFLLFGNDLRANDANIKSLPIKEQATTIGKMWNDLSEEKKAKYAAKSAELKADYVIKREAYEKTEDYKKFREELVKADKKEGKAKKRSGPTKMSAYRIFISETKESPSDEKDPELSGKGHMTKCGIKWARLSEAEKKAYQDKADKMNSEQNTDLLADSHEQESE